MLVECYDGCFGVLPIPKPAGSPVPVITRGGTGTTVTIPIVPAGTLIPSEGLAISSVVTATQQGLTFNFPIPAEMALQQRTVGTGLWGSVFGGQYASAWVNAPNNGEWGPGTGGVTSGGASGGTSSPPPEEEQPTPPEEGGEPEVPYEPAPTVPASTGGAEGPPMGGGTEPEGVTPLAQGGGQGQEGGGMGAGTMITVDIKSNNSFFSWLRGLFGY